jgi:hypothetical protein
MVTISPAVDAAKVAELQARYPSILAYQSRQAADLELNASLLGAAFSDADLAAFAPLADRITWADLSGTAITDASAPVLAKWRNLRTLRLAREAGGWSLVKLEVLSNTPHLYPDMPETLRALEMLVKDGCDVMVYCTVDVVFAKRLEEAGALEILPGGRGYRVRFEEPWSDFPSDDPVADAARMNRWIESEIRRNPAQYLWVHRRFKTRPPGEPSLY